MNEGLSKNDFCLWECNGKFVRNKKEYNTLKDFIDYILKHERLCASGNYNGYGLFHRGYVGVIENCFKYMPLSANYYDSQYEIRYFMKYCEYEECDDYIWYQLNSEERARYRKRIIWYEYLKGLKHKSIAKDEDILKRVKIYYMPRELFIDHLDRWKKGTQMFSISQVGKKWQWLNEYSRIDGNGDSVIIIPMNQITDRILEISSAKGEVDISNTEYSELKISNSEINKLRVALIERTIREKNGTSWKTNGGTSRVRITNCKLTDESFFKEQCNGKVSINDIEISNSIVPKNIISDNANLKIENLKSDVDLITCEGGLKIEDNKYLINKIKGNRVEITGDCKIGEIQVEKAGAGVIEIKNHFDKYSGKVEIKKASAKEFTVAGTNIRVDELAFSSRLGITKYNDEKVQINFKKLKKDCYIYVNIPKIYGIPSSVEQGDKYKELKKAGIDLREEGKPYNGKLQIYCMGADN